MPALPQICEGDARRMMRSVGNSRQPVELGFTIFSISEICPVAQCFNADIKVFCRWRDEALEDDPDMTSLQSTGKLACGIEVDRLPDGRFPDAVVKPSDVGHVGRLRPLYEFGNGKEVQPIEGEECFYLSPNDKLGWVRWEKRWNVTFHQSFDMKQFPFDIHKLHIIIRLPQRSDFGRNIKEYETETGNKQQEIKDWVPLSEWMRFQPICTCKEDAKRRAQFVIELPIERRAEYYVKNIICMMASICFVCFLAFGIPSKDIAERLGVVLTMKLTSVAFKMVIGDALPKVSYLTLMDVYLNGMFAFMLLVVVENVLVAALYRGELISDIVSENWLDMYSFLAFVLAFVIFNLWYICRVIVSRRASKKQLAGLLRVRDYAKLVRAKHAEQAKKQDQDVQGQDVQEKPDTKVEVRQDQDVQKKPGTKAEPYRLGISAAAAQAAARMES